MRRQVISCVENSPLVNRFTKPPAFAINFISVLGYAFDETTSKVLKRAQNHVQAEQEKMGLEILAGICSGNFPSVLGIIANEKRSVEKIRSQFPKLASLVKVKRSLIEPIFIAFSKFNPSLGDWMIGELLTQDNFQEVATLTANLIMSETNTIPQRLDMLHDHMLT